MDSTVSIITETISGLLPLFTPFNHILAGALLTRSNTCDEGCVVELLGKLATSGEDEAVLEPLVNAGKQLLALPNPPALDKLKTWVGSESGLATAFYLAGVIPFLTERAVIPPTEEEDEEPDQSTPNEIIDILVFLAANVKGDVSRKREAQKAFFSNPVLLSVAVSAVKKIEDYEKYTASARATDIFKLSKGYADAVPVLLEQDIFPSLLKMFDDEDLDVEDYGPLLGWIADADKAALVAVLRAHIAQLQPPVDGGSGGGGGKGGKKKKKKGKYTPRISKAGVLLRLAVLSTTSTTAKEAVIEVGGVELMAQALEEDDSELWTQPLQCFKALLESGDARIHEPAVSLLPRITTIWGSESTPESLMPPLMEFLQAFITAYDVQPLLDAGWDLLLIKKLSEDPANVCDMSVLVETVSVLFRSGDAGRKAVLDRLRQRIDDEEALESEHNWGTTHALRCLVYQGEDIAPAILELGALDYAVKLLQSEDIQVSSIP